MAAKILVIDDDFELREAIVDLLLEAGFDAVAAKDGRDGLLEARMHSPVGAIVLDLSMPMMDGPAFRAEQLADEALAAIPIIVLSANDEVRRQGTELGAAATLPKPFNPEELVEAVRACTGVDQRRVA